MATDIRIIVPTATALPSGPNVIWETNFAQDGAFVAEYVGGNLVNTAVVPNGWNGTQFEIGNDTGAGWIGQPTGGIGGSVAMRCQYPGATEPGGQQPTNSLLKHLTGVIDEGYPELYIRYRVKFPNAFKAGDGDNELSYWKWMRLWQNTHPTNPSAVPGKWTENREDAYYVVINWGGSLTYGTTPNIVFGANSSVSDDWARAVGSVDGGRAKFNWFKTGTAQADFDITDSHFESVGGGAWEIDHSVGASRGEFVNNTTQGWHTIEYHIKAATGPSAEDGIGVVYFDGLQQGPPVRIMTEGYHKIGDINTITKGNPTTVTLNGAASDIFQTNDTCLFSGVTGMSEIEGMTGDVTYVSDTSFTVNIDSTSFGTHTTNTGNAKYLIVPSGWGGLFTGAGTMVEGAGTGWNMITVMDNMNHWNAEWGDSGSFDGWIDFNDIVIATSRIGHTYDPQGDGS